MTSGAESDICVIVNTSRGVLSSPEQTCLLPLADGGVGFKDMRPLSFLTSCYSSSSCHAYWA